MVVQVGSLMWLRTTMNYQYRHGTSTGQALRTLYAQGGVPRFYQGVTPALLQGPLARFGDTAANAGMLALLEANPETNGLPILAKTMAASAAAALWRVNLMPIDTVKTILQVEGKKGLAMLGSKYRAGGARVFYSGAIAAMSATFVGHYPWFATHNMLNELLPQYESMWGNLGRNALMGFCSSVRALRAVQAPVAFSYVNRVCMGLFYGRTGCLNTKNNGFRPRQFVSDCSSNSIRVIKVTKQASERPISYRQATAMVSLEQFSAV
jgi:hypothetical protein